MQVFGWCRDGIGYKEDSIIPDKGIARCCLAATVGQHSGDYQMLYSLLSQEIIEFGAEK
jgi:hypothetical protein